MQLNLKVGAIKANLLRVTTQYNVNNGKLTKVLGDLEETTSKCDQLQIELLRSCSLAKQREAELMRLARENAQLMKNRDMVQKRIQNFEADKTELAKEVTKLRYIIFIESKSNDRAHRHVNWYTVSRPPIAVIRF